MFATAYPKLRSWFASITSPSTTHASGMLIILGILAAVADAESVREPIAARNPKASSSSNPTAGQTTESNPNEKSGNQDMVYQLALGMLVSQGLIRLITYISNRREAAALAAQKKDDDLLNNTNSGDKKGKGKKSGDLSLNALDEMDLDEEAIRKRRSEHLASLSNTATLLESDSEDEDYEESEGDDESESEDVTEDESEEEEIVESEH